MNLKNILFLLMLAIIINFKIFDEEYENIKKGYDYFRKSDFKQSAKYFENIFFINPENALNPYNLALVQMKLNNYKNAVSSFKLSASYNKNDKNLLIKTYYNIADSMMKIKNYQEAIIYYKKCLKLNPDFFNAKYNLKTAIMLNQDSVKTSIDKNSDYNKSKNKKDNTNSINNDAGKQNNKQNANNEIPYSLPIISKENADNIFRSAVDMNRAGKYKQPGVVSSDFKGISW
ncbi:tetratricopeptide repeat protein [Candidatus Dependentiae bacterium]|nr:tetratricopeptide repeat protein [Candidatus Dependentiae bacterium]